MSYTTADLLRDVGNIPLMVWPIIFLAGPLLNLLIGLIAKLGEAVFHLGKGPASKGETE